MNYKKSLLLILLLLILDQWTKIYIKTNFNYGEIVQVFSWFHIHFIENPGAAWGAKLSDILPISDSSGKLVLTIFRILAVTGIGYWLYDIIQKKVSSTYIFAVSFIFAGALGNIIDSVFYGLIFDESTRTHVATLFADDPYGGLFYGKVVDMLSLPMIDTIWPEWVPYFGGKSFSFFDPIFNIADMAISTGVGILIVFNKTVFGPNTTTEEQSNETLQSSENE